MPLPVLKTRSGLLRRGVPLNKGAIRFPLSEPVPVKLIERIAKFRAKEAAERQNAKAASPNKRLPRATTSAPARRTT